MTQKLLEHRDIDINLADRDGVPPLHKAVASTHFTLTKLMLEREEGNLQF